MTESETNAVLSAMGAQRNAALDDVCRQAAIIAALKEEIEALRGEVETLKGLRSTGGEEPRERKSCD